MSNLKKSDNSNLIQLQPLTGKKASPLAWVIGLALLAIGIAGYAVHNPDFAGSFKAGISANTNGFSTSFELQKEK